MSDVAQWGELSTVVGIAVVEEKRSRAAPAKRDGRRSKRFSG